MAGSVLFYTGVCGVLFGAVLLWARPKRGLLLLGFGALTGIAALLLPPRRSTVRVRATLLDELLPAWQFAERHRIMVRSSCDTTWQALQAVTASEVTGFRALTWIRRLGRSGPESLLNPPPNEPLLRVATRTGFLLLGDQPGHELVLGAVVLAPPGARRPANAADFGALQDPGYARAALNFHLEEQPAGCLVTTETRVFATDQNAERTFGRYWKVIYPGSALIRRMWLRAIKRRSESPRLGE